MLEHTARFKSGAFFNFNGTGGIWRRKAIEDSGGWSSRTVTEDLDLSYRAQLKGWKFIYLPDVVCHGELPVNIPNHFKLSRSVRTKGAIQVARQVLRDIWVSSLLSHENGINTAFDSQYRIFILHSDQFAFIAEFVPASSFGVDNH